MWTARLARSMVTFVRVASARDLPPGEGRVVVVQGHPVALFNVEGRFFAVSNVCLHRGGPIGEGMLDAAPEPGRPDPRSPPPDRRPPWDADGVRRVPAPGRGDLAGPRARRRVRRQRASPPEPRVPAIPTPRRRR